MNLNPLRANLTEIVINNDLTVLFSYKTPVACELKGKIFKTEKFWSKTTSRHINQWLDGRQAEEAYQTFFDSLIGGQSVL